MARAALCALVAAAAFGCGQSREPATSGFHLRPPLSRPPAEPGTVAPVSTSGTPMDGGVLFPTGMAGSSAIDPASCALSACRSRELLGLTLEPCCLPAGGCGVMYNGLCSDGSLLPDLAPAVIDPHCPSIKFMLVAAGGQEVELQGCCHESGVCSGSTSGLLDALPLPVMMSMTGIDIPDVCLSPNELEQIVAGDALDGGASIACDYPDGGP